MCDGTFMRYHFFEDSSLFADSRKKARWGCWAALLSLWFHPTGELSAQPSEFARSVQPFFSRNCYTCHNAKLKTGGLNLQAYDNPDAVIADREEWEKILSKLRSAEMPPKGTPRPNEVELKLVESWI